MDGNQTISNTAGVRPETLALRDELLQAQMRRLKRLAAGDATIDLLEGEDSVWLVVRREGAGGFACRTAYAPGRRIATEVLEEDHRSLRLGIATALGTFDVRVEIPRPEQAVVRWSVRLKPSENLRLMTWPRDLYPLDDSGDPLGAKGTVLASQRGLNSGLVYLTLEKPRFGAALYFQDLTALNDYFQTAASVPDGVVGGQWPDLGYQPPVGEKPLRKGQEVTIADSLLSWSPEIPKDPQHAGLQFLNLLAAVYPYLTRPESLYHDWVWRAEQTVKDLAESPDATLMDHGFRYVHPYTAAEHPDSMVQLTVLWPMLEFAQWRGEPIGLTDELREGFARFFDPRLSTVRRYLP